MPADRYGTGLLALNTNRPPDLVRGAKVVRLELDLPQIVEAQISLWESGARKDFGPKDASELLWSLPAASHLNGDPASWMTVPGVQTLLPGWKLLEVMDPEDWPKDQAALRKLVADAAPGEPTPVQLAKVLAKDGAIGQLNDLVLIFKFAAIGMKRPLRLAANLYRLARAVLASENALATREDMVAWLTAPLGVSRVFVAPLGGRLVRPPVGGDTGPTRPPRDAFTAVFDMDQPRTAAVLRRIEEELDQRERHYTSGAMVEALRSSGADEGLIRRVASRLGNNALNVIATPVSAVSPPSTTGGANAGMPAARASTGTRPPYRPRMVKSYIAGIPVLLDVAEAEERLLKTRTALAEGFSKALPASMTARMAALGLSLYDFTAWPDLLTAASRRPSYLEPVGRSDLLLVRQTTTGYRRAEIAYVENVLIGETRSREHTVRTLSREETLSSRETETEETKDLQVTDRGELNREVSNIIREDLQASGSVEITSRGPTQVVVTGELSFRRSTEEAAKSVEKFSRETIERAVKRSLERVKREVKTLFEQETLELNKHGFELAGNAPDHVIGVYQYLERVSHARLFWYGERELYDLLVPEPAALVWQQAVTQSELHIPFQKPDQALFDSLTLDNIADLRDEVIAAFRVADIPALPDTTRVMGVPLAATGKGDDAKYTAFKEVQMPDGYEVTGALLVVSVEVEDSDDKPNGGVAVGDQVALWTAPTSGNQGSATHDFTYSTPLPGPTIAVAFNADNFTSLAGTISLKLNLTDEGQRAWALQAYARVADRFEQLRREYEQAVLNASLYQATETVTLPVGSRERLQQIVRNELQRSAIDIMRDAPVDVDLIADYSFTMPNGAAASHPVVDTVAVKAAEAEIRFLQQAFEWEHLSWVLYPYFWGRRGGWTRKVSQNYPDPEFGAFLDAGAARLQIPVRPGVEEFVKHYMETGEVFGGEGLPKIGDPGYLPFIAEQLTALNAPGEEVPWPPENPREWDIVSPTSLILVRPRGSDQLPTWDPLTGKETN